METEKTGELAGDVQGTGRGQAGDKRAEILRWLDVQDAENGRANDALHYDDAHDCAPDWSCRACWATVHATKPYHSFQRPDPFPHEPLPHEPHCAAVALPLALAALRTEVHAHGGDPAEPEWCVTCSDESGWVPIEDCATINRIHAAIFGEEK